MQSIPLTQAPLGHELLDDEGVTAIEYGLIAALIAVFIIASVTIVGSKLEAVFTAISAAITAAL
jgi:pilus assembly protein Flp/PilA